MERSGRPGMANTLAGMLAALALIFLLALSMSDPPSDEPAEAQPTALARPSAQATSRPLLAATPPALEQRFVLRGRPVPAERRDFLGPTLPPATTYVLLNQMPILRGEKTAPMPVIPGERTVPMPGAPEPLDPATPTVAPAIP